MQLNFIIKIDNYTIKENRTIVGKRKNLYSFILPLILHLV